MAENRKGPEEQAGSLAMVERSSRSSQVDGTSPRLKGRSRWPGGGLKERAERMSVAGW